MQDTSRGGLPHLYDICHAQRRVVHLRYGGAQSMPFLVLTEHPGETERPPLQLVTATHSIAWHIPLERLRQYSAGTSITHG